MDKPVSKHEKHNQKSHASKKRVSPKAGGGVPKDSDSSKQINASTKKVVGLIRQDAGEETAKRLEPVVKEAFKQFYTGDVNKPLVVNGKKVSNQGRDMTAKDMLDSIADQFGTQAVTGISVADFSSGAAFRNTVGKMLISKANPNHDAKGRFTSGSGAKTVVAPKLSSNAPAQLQTLASAGGFTFNPRRNELRRKGVAVAVRKDTERVFDEADFAKNGPKIVSGYMKQNAELLAQPRMHLGAWKDKGKVYLDVSKVTSSIKEAADIGRSNDQIGIFDLATFTTYTRVNNPVGGGYKYFPSSASSEGPKKITPRVSGLGMVFSDVGLQPYQFGKADKGVVYVEADQLDEFGIQSFVRKVMSMASISKADPTSSDVHLPTIMNNQKRKRKRKMNLAEVVEKKERLKDPKGGLTAAGRKKFNRETGSNLKPGVKGKADTPEKMRRKGSFLTRFFTNPSGPMTNDKGEPTRLALSAAAWGEPVPKNRSDAAELASKGRRLLERYENAKEK